MDLHEGGDDLIFHGNRGPFVVILLLQGLVLKSESLVINTSISDTVCSKSVGEVSLLSVTKLLEEFVLLYRAVIVEDEAVDSAVRYSRTHHPHHSSPSGTEYLPGDTNLHGVTIRNEAPSVLLQSYQGLGVDVS